MPCCGLPLAPRWTPQFHLLGMLAFFLGSSWRSSLALLWCSLCIRQELLVVLNHRIISMDEKAHWKSKWVRKKMAQGSSERQLQNRSNHWQKTNCPGMAGGRRPKPAHIYIHLKTVSINTLNKAMRLEEQMGKWNKQMEKLYLWEKK